MNYICKRCGHGARIKNGVVRLWISRLPEGQKPEACPRCHSRKME